MAFSFLKKLFGVSDAPAEDAPSQTVESAEKPQQHKRRHQNKNDERSSRRADGFSARRRGEQPQKELRFPRDTREAPSNLSPEQQQEALDKLNQFVLHVAKQLVDFPDQVSTTVQSGDNQHTIVISCAKGDAGKLIGRNGKIITSIRVLVSGNAARNGLHATVDIQD